MSGRARACGSCTLCCTLQGVREGLDQPKPPGVPCVHLDACGGCAIYERRPMECMTYACMWLDGFGMASDRPDKLGVMLEVQEPFVVAARPIRPGMEKRPRVRKLLTRLMEHGFAVGIIQVKDNPKDFTEPFEVEVYTDPKQLPR